MRIAAVWDRTPLRVRLLAGVLALVIVALTGAGFVAVATLRGYLVQREDAQLRSAATLIAHGPDHGPEPGGQPDPDGDNYQHLPSAFVTLTLNPDGSVYSGPSSHLVDNKQSLPTFPHLTLAETKAHDERPFTIGAGDDQQWRAIALPLEHGSGTLLVATSLGEVESTAARLGFLELSIGAVAVVVIAVVGGIVVRAALRPLRQVEATAADIAAGDLSHRVPERDQRTEVGRLGAAFNTMLERIESAFHAQAASEAEARHSEEKMRRFVADASHELRTPLTSIRGFAELYRLQDRGDHPDLTRGMTRIEQEAKRMGLLVDDLLLLARLDQEQPLRSEPVDLLQIAADVVHDARITTDRTIRVVVGRTDPVPVVTGDPARLHQVLANLVNNAVEHTDTPVEIRIGTTGEGTEARAVLEVVDHGPGLDPAVADHVFERFYRADTARSREDGGAGLGLAIVAALVAKHGGAADVVPTPGGGATFRVTLPLAGSPEHVRVG